LDAFADNFTILSEADLDFKPKGATPDLCIYPKMHVDFSDDDVIKMQEPPITAIEILSPKQALEDIVSKARKIYFPNQVKSVWVVLPSLRSIALLHDAKSDPQFFTSADILSDPATGIQLNIGEAFRT
jgi:Uma2 family endonuclease